jgi:hypothetical protein
MAKRKAEEERGPIFNVPKGLLGEKAEKSRASKGKTGMKKGSGVKRMKIKGAKSKKD